jgi:hypothetical protein
LDSELLHTLIVEVVGFNTMFDVDEIVRLLFESTVCIARVVKLAPANGAEVLYV